jgi:hypothetical protein
MPTLNLICSELSPLVAAKDYLRQRDDGALAASRSLESRYCPVNYWSQSSLCLIQLVLSRLGSSWYSELRASYLNLVYDAVPTGRKKGLYFKRKADVCPLCGSPDSLDHVILRCTHLFSKCREIKLEVQRSYEYGAPPKSGRHARDVPPGCAKIFAHILDWRSTQTLFILTPTLTRGTRWPCGWLGLRRPPSLCWMRLPLLYSQPSLKHTF